MNAVAPGPTFTAAVVSDAAGLHALELEWDRLLGTMGRPCPFLSWDWVCTWWKHFGKGSRLFLLTLRSRDGALAGIAPLRICRRRVFGVVPVRSLEMIGYRGSVVCADHLDFLAAEAERAVVAQALVAELWGKHRKVWDVFTLADLAEDSPIPAAFRQLGGQLWLREIPGEICYYVPLKPDTGALWGQLRARHPEFFAVYWRNRRRLARSHEVRFRVQVDGAEWSELGGDLVRLHALARQRHGEGGAFRRPAYRAFHAEVATRLAERRSLYVARLECDGRVVAILYGYCLGGVLFFYQSGFDTGWGARGVGKQLLGWVIEDAAGRLGAHEFDFLRGSEAYKTRWAEQYRRTRHLRGWQGSVRARLARLDWRARQRAGALRRRLQRWRKQGAGA